MKYKLPRKDKSYYILRDIASSFEYGAVKSDKRIQVVMPKRVVEELAREFPKVDRSRLLTQLALEALLQKKRYRNDKTLNELAGEEQADLDTMLEYLEERE